MATVVVLNVTTSEVAGDVTAIDAASRAANTATTRPHNAPTRASPTPGLDMAMVREGAASGANAAIEHSGCSSLIMLLVVKRRDTPRRCIEAQLKLRGRIGVAGISTALEAGGA